MAINKIFILIVFLQCYSIFAIVENRFSRFRAPVTIQGCTRIAGAFDIDGGLKFGPDFVANPIKTDPRYVYDSKQAELDPTIWIQVCEPLPTDTPQKYRETFRFEGANGGIMAMGYKLSNELTQDPDSVTEVGCKLPWIITPWGEWNGRDTYIRGIKGLQGEKGDKGLEGEKGIRGEMGIDGVNGATGATGDQGDNGVPGQTGPRGFDGVIGQQGPQGPQGFTGPKGTHGITGPQGYTGVQGFTGAVGPAGDIGNKGPQGNQGPQGVTGPVGYTGAVGPVGNQGQKGDKGQVGNIGPIGITGAVGPQGNTGDKGIQGVSGEQGPQGPQGINGNQGVNGVKGIKGELGPQGPQGIQGIQGPTGSRGFTGVKGVTGAQGPVGFTGATGLVGLEGSPGANGIKGAPGANGADSLICPATTYYYLFRNTLYIQSFSYNTATFTGTGNYDSHLSYGRIFGNVTYTDGTTTGVVSTYVDTPMCTRYCDRILFGGHGIWNKKSVPGTTIPLNVRTLNVLGDDDLAVAVSPFRNHYYWVLSSSVSGGELTGAQTNAITALLARNFDCTPPHFVVGWVSSFIPRSSGDSSNLNNRCLAYIRVDFEGRVNAYRIGTCNPTFNNGGTFDYFSHLDFNGLSYVPGVIGANSPIIQGIKIAFYDYPVYQPTYYTTNLLVIDDDNQERTPQLYSQL